MVIENDDLTEQQKLFCFYYLECFNATKAYQKAYNCAYQTANPNSYRMIVNDGIKAELHRLKADLQQDTFVGIKDLIQEYVKQAFADITDFTEFGNEVKVETELNEDFEPVPVLDLETGEPITYLTSFVA
ncbi:terminase small subunit [Enterococcus faecalis 06-MB-DW-09]|nr:terminase small subunit [Enterococcus faecalis 06-MB-DW-09]